MNKKISSFVLAISLIFGLGVVNLFAANEYRSLESYDNNIAEVKENNDGSITVTMTDNEKALVGNVESRISSVFTYKAGMLLFVMDKDRNVTLYDQGKQRMILAYQSKNDGSGQGTGFSVTSFNVYGTDVQDIEKVGGLANYCKTFGMTDKQLSYTNNSSATATGNNQVQVSWLSELQEHLNKGVNFSATMNITDGKGTSVTLQENGKNLKTIAYDGTVTQTYVYNAFGTLDYVDSKTYKLEGSTTTSTDKPTDGKAKYTESYQRTYYNVYGQADNVKDANGNVTATYSYAYNGSMLSSFDKNTGNTTYYDAGKASYVLNSSGAVVSKYYYHANGSLDGVYEYGYDKQGNQISTKISAYKFGKFIATADLSGTGGSRTFDEIRESVESMRKESKNYSEATAAQVQQYMEEIRDAVKSSDTAKQKKAERDLYEYTSKHAPKWIIDIVNCQQSFKYVNGSTVVSNSSKYSNLTQIGIYSSDLDDNLGFLYSLGFKKEDIDRMKLTDNGTSSLATATLQYGGIQPGEIDDGKTSYVGQKTHKEIVKKGKSGLNLTVSLTINDRGAQAYTVENACKYQIKSAEDQVVTTVDPTVIGNYEGITTIDGKTYAKVSATEVNIMDGTGFQSADGETILVEVNEETADLLKGMKKGDKIMFMGDVSKDIDGYMTMKMNTNYSGGVAIGEEDITAIKADIQKEKLDWVKENTAVNTAIFGNNGITVDWAAGWNVLTGKASVQELRKHKTENGGVYLAF